MHTQPQTNMYTVSDTVFGTVFHAPQHGVVRFEPQRPLSDLRIGNSLPANQNLLFKCFFKLKLKAK